MLMPLGGGGVVYSNVGDKTKISRDTVTSETNVDLTYMSFYCVLFCPNNFSCYLHLVIMILYVYTFSIITEFMFHNLVIIIIIKVSLILFYYWRHSF